MTLFFIAILFYGPAIQHLLHTNVCPYFLWPGVLTYVYFMTLIVDASAPKFHTILQFYGHRLHEHIILWF